MAVKKPAKPAAKSAKKKAAPAKKTVAKKVAAKAPAKPARSAGAKVAAKPTKVAKPAAKRVAAKTVVNKVKPAKVGKPVSKKAAKASDKGKVKISNKQMNKTDVRSKRNPVKTKEQKLKARFEEPVVAKHTPKAIERSGETRLVKKVEKETAAKLSSKYTVGDITQFTVKIPKNGIDHATIEEKLQALFQLQQIDSEIDRIRYIRGELPNEVKDLEDDVAGLETRIKNYHKEVEDYEKMVSEKKQAIKDSNSMIKKYESQQSNVKNNREYESLNKEVEYQKLEIQLSEKRIKEYTAEAAAKKMMIESTQEMLDHRSNDLNTKKKELETIIEETKKEEATLLEYSKKAGSIIEERLLGGYVKLRENAQNGLGVVTIQRDACGGCFNKVPPQRQLDIKQRKKVIVCEHCGRILVDPEIMTPLP